MIQVDVVQESVRVLGRSQVGAKVDVVRPGVRVLAQAPVGGTTSGGGVDAAELDQRIAHMTVEEWRADGPPGPYALVMLLDEDQVTGDPAPFLIVPGVVDAGGMRVVVRAVAAASHDVGFWARLGDGTQVPFLALEPWHPVTKDYLESVVGPLVAEVEGLRAEVARLREGSV